MKTVLAMVLGSMFLAGSVMACPGEGGAHKDTKTAVQAAPFFCLPGGASAFGA